MTVDEALEISDRMAVGFPQGLEYVGVVLAAEVRRLRAMLEPTPDAQGYKPSAYELAEILLQIPSKPGTSGIFDLEAMAARIQQDRARLLDEAAARACAFIDANVEAYNYNYKAFRAAIKGAAHE